MNRNSVLPLGFSIRLGIIKNVGRTFVDFEFLDKIQKQSFRAPIPHPYAGRGGGILVGIEKDTIVIIACGPGEKYLSLYPQRKCINST